MIDSYDADVQRPIIVCQDGFRVSVQASAMHYCKPRVTGLAIYTHYEVSYPSQVEPLIDPWMERVHMPFDENDNNPLKSIYCNVPDYVVVAMLKKHGGVDVYATFGCEESNGRTITYEIKAPDC